MLISLTSVTYLFFALAPLPIMKTLAYLVSSSVYVIIYHNYENATVPALFHQVSEVARSLSIRNPWHAKSSITLHVFLIYVVLPRCIVKISSINIIINKFNNTSLLNISFHLIGLAVSVCNCQSRVLGLISVSFESSVAGFFISTS